MARGLIKLQEELHHHLLKLRSIEATIRQPQFERLWADSNETQQLVLRAYIKNADKDAVIRWSREHPSLQLGEKSLADLKKIAYRLGIKNYSRKGKIELIQDISKKEEQYGSQQGIHA